MYKVTLFFQNGGRHTLKGDLDFFALSRALDKCEIKAFKVELLSPAELDKLASKKAASPKK